jgi:hypothetical protein
MSRKFKFRENLSRTTGTLYEDLCIFMIASPGILLRIRNVLDKFVSVSTTNIESVNWNRNNVFYLLLCYIFSCQECERLMSSCKCPMVNKFGFLQQIFIEVPSIKRH